MGSESHRLYIRVPFRIDDELKIKALHPDIKKVILPRQKSAHWCFAEFENYEKCTKAYEDLKKTKIQGKGLKISYKIKPTIKKVEKQKNM